jgi:NAD(P)-dependent dehydrogenase (short-subunit alcohol dehydrogenase family)
VRVLVNNAGAIYPTRSETQDGCECTFALNVRAPYRLASGLASSLAAGAPARVVNVASAAHRGLRLHLDDLEGRTHWSSYGSYGRSKLALILLTSEMGRRIDPRSVAYFSVHPGLVRTRWGAHARPAMRVAVRLGALMAISPERAARTVLYAALDGTLEGRTGLYVAREHVVEPSLAARDASSARGLFEALAAVPP